MPESASKSPSADAQREAQQLLKAAGSPQLAKDAIRSSAGHAAEPSASKDAFAHQHGFASYLSMFEASKPAGKAEGKNWLITNVNPKLWILWNEEDLQVVLTFATYDEAIDHLKQTVGAKAKSNPNDQPPTG